MTGPVGSAYPGKYVTFGFAALLALIIWRSTRAAIRVRIERRRNAALGISLKPDPKQSAGTNIVVAVVAALLLVTALASIWQAWPN